MATKPQQINKCTLHSAFIIIQSSVLYVIWPSHALLLMYCPQSHLTRISILSGVCFRDIELKLNQLYLLAALKQSRRPYQKAAQKWEQCKSILDLSACPSLLRFPGVMNYNVVQSFLSVRSCLAEKALNNIMLCTHYTLCVGRALQSQRPLPCFKQGIITYPFLSGSSG